MKKYIALFLVVGIVFAFAGCSGNKQTTFDIGIVIPAGTEDEMIFSNEEISSIGKEITITPLEGFDNVEFGMNLIEGSIQSDYPATTLTTGTSIKRNVEKGAWYTLGINVDNPTDKDITLYLRVEPVEVRIK